MGYTVGDVLPFGVTVHNASGTPENATAVSLVIVCDANGATTTYPGVVGVSGVYAVDHPASVAGTYRGYWEATGVNASAETQVFTVAESTDRSLISLADAKRHLNIPATTTTDDEELADVVRSVTALIENETGPIVRRTVTETFDGGGSHIRLTFRPVLSVTSVTEEGSTVPASGYTLDAGAGLLYREADSVWLRSTVRRGITVTYVTGRTTVPENVHMAVRVAVQDVWTQQRGPSRVPALGSAEISEAPGDRPYILPRAALRLLAPHKRAPLVA